MVVVMEERATEAQIEKVVARLTEMGMDVHRSTGVTRTVLGAVGQGHPDKALIELLDGVHEVLRITEPYKRASRTFKPEDTIVTLDDVRIGGDEVIVMAGPCSAETEEQCMAAADGMLPAVRKRNPRLRQIAEKLNGLHGKGVREPFFPRSNEKGLPEPFFSSLESARCRSPCPFRARGTTVIR